jgi:hypothetical protein
MSDKAKNIIGFGAVGLLLAAALAVVVAERIERTEARERFFSECREDHKDYECVAMWRSGSRSVVPIIIPHSR